MLLTQLAIQQFRNICSATLEPRPGINVFYGQNGSGKTSILEAIYFLGLGRSFRTHLIQRIIQENANQLLLFAQLQQGDQSQAVGVERSRQGEKKIRMNGESIQSLAPLAKQLPIQLLTTESHRYFHDGPQPRRQFLDWGVFHVEPGFYPLWQQLQRALKQRNAALKNQLSHTEIGIWDQELMRLSPQIDQYRKEYIAQLQPILSDLLVQVLPEFADLQLRYVRGWSLEKELSAVLSAHLARDQQLGYTQYGPQRADLQLYADKIPVSDYLSQGQQKLAAYALHLAQGILLQKLTHHTPIYLIDDLPSELDPSKRQFVTTLLTRLNAQVFMTAAVLSELTDMIPLDQAHLFHVEQGQVHVPRGTINP